MLGGTSYNVLSEASTCSNTKTALNAAIKEFRGPGSDDETLACAFSKFFYHADACAAAAATLNDMTEAFRDGGFQSCEVTDHAYHHDHVRPCMALATALLRCANVRVKMGVLLFNDLPRAAATVGEQQ